MKKTNIEIKKSKFGWIDRVGKIYYGFIPNRSQNLFNNKIPTHKQFFEAIKGLGNCKIVYKNRVIAYR